MKELNNYLSHTLNKRPEWMMQLEQYAETHHVPIMEPVSMNFLTQLVRMKQPANILEIGTAIGYSALRMLDASPNSHITTIEKSEDMYHRACHHIEEGNARQAIQPILGDALEKITSLYTNDVLYDFIFIDAAKGKYQEFFELVQPLVKKDTVIVCDNTLFKGYVADEHKLDNKRLHKLARKIRSFNEWVMKQEEYHSSIVPIGDGLTISIHQ